MELEACEFNRHDSASTRPAKVVLQFTKRPMPIKVPEFLKEWNGSILRGQAKGIRHGVCIEPDQSPRSGDSSEDQPRAHASYHTLSLG
jgi:hypothetical protein